MKTINALLLLVLAAHAALAAASKPTRVPPPGLKIPDQDRTELSAGVAALAREIETLRAAGKTNLLADVEIFHKAVDWALRYDEFYRSNEVGVARGLLRTGQERAKQLREGRPAWLTATGLVVRGYFSRIDGSVQPYGLIVPATLATDATKPRRLDVWLHGRDNNLTELKFISDRMKSYGEFAPADTLVLHPYGRYCNAFKFAGETDVFEALAHVKAHYRVDEERVAIRGFSMGGAGVWHLAAHHPHLWAVATPGAGFAETAEYTKLGTNRAGVPAWEQTLWQLYDATDYAANFANLPVVSYAGLQDSQRQSGDVMERAMKAQGLALPRVWGTNVGHKYTPEAKKEIEAFAGTALARGRVREPGVVRFTTRTLAYPRGPGLEITALERHWQRADVVVQETAGRLVVSTTNVAGLTLERATGAGRLRHVVIDGQTVQAMVHSEGPRASVRLIKDAAGRWSDSAWLAAPPEAPAKSPVLHGPIDDAFMDSFLIVRPTGRALHPDLDAWVQSRLNLATNEWRAQFRGHARVKDDVDVTEADMAVHHLILFGDPQSNRLLARLGARLPIRWDRESVVAGTQSLSAADHAPVLIAPNPLNRRRYVVLNSGFTFGAAGSGSNAQQTPKLPDYAIYKLAGNSVVLAGFFNEQWRLK